MPFCYRRSQRAVCHDRLPPCALADDMQSGLFAPCEVHFNCTSHPAKCQLFGDGDGGRSVISVIRQIPRRLCGKKQIRNLTAGANRTMGAESLGKNVPPSISAVGLKDASGYISVVGRKIGEQMNKVLRRLRGAPQRRNERRSELSFRQAYEAGFRLKACQDRGILLADQNGSAEGHTLFQGFRDPQSLRP